MTACLASVELVDLLLQHVADLQGSGAVVAAAGYGRLDTVSFLLSRGADIHEFPPPDPERVGCDDIESPLHAAAAAGELGVAEYLIKEGAKTSLRDSQGWTPLARARENRDTEMVKLLLSYRSPKGCTSVCESGQGETPLLVSYPPPLSFLSKKSAPSESSEDE